MTRTDQIANEYFKWLSDIVCKDLFSEEISYNKLLVYLHSTEFRWPKSLPMDRNRAEDGIDLRYRFTYQHPNLGVQADRYIHGPCSVLEMMIALAKRCENSMMADEDFGDRTSVWFWKMFNNLGLNKYPDDIWNESIEDEVIKIISIFLNRQYDYCGNGNLFKFDNPKYDVRELEIWDQMNYYMSEIVEQNLRIT